ncbi:5-formyltetrahydrofolate cyclo-ligase [Methylovirgula sp. 4M-Z18]|uniref:5-formyltetrahydrofolate cyclo-ligase n=1 Tax=Methylovirgula sp. 4M-Z18 TaxID=2293567 RepID=UPI000E2FAF5C|nr:5-formyltetrahydrofolate cyclo-ligase [Methylovirgula sp. 4M-Z18]RFB78418.1 5-formyltetrahydrofolate cyclo-ligase [Methylovirgula sp. 4M-Z18]
MTLAEQKEALRRDALARRDAMSAGARASASLLIAEKAMTLRPHFLAGAVSAFWPIRSEIDTRPLLHRLQAHGLTTALPALRHPDMEFRLWREGDAMKKAAFGLHEPQDGAPAVLPATLFVPLAAFDRAGHRIGYGGGYYDRALEKLQRRGSVRTIGLAFATQELDTVPAEAHDRQLDYVVTEREVIACAAPKR